MRATESKGCERKWKTASQLQAYKPATTILVSSAIWKWRLGPLSRHFFLSLSPFSLSSSLLLSTTRHERPATFVNASPAAADLSKQIISSSQVGLSSACKPLNAVVTGIYKSWLVQHITELCFGSFLAGNNRTEPKCLFVASVNVRQIAFNRGEWPFVWIRSSQPFCSFLWAPIKL